MTSVNDLVHRRLQPICTERKRKPVASSSEHAHQSPTVQLLQLHRQGFRSGSYAVWSPKGTKKHIKLPCFIVARGGVSFSISPPKNRRGKRLSPQAWRPSRAVVRLRKLRRATHFARLVKVSHCLCGSLSGNDNNNECHQAAIQGSIHLRNPLSRQHPDMTYLRPPPDLAKALVQSTSPPTPFRRAPRLRRSARSRKVALSCTPTATSGNGPRWEEVQWTPRLRSPHQHAHGIKKPAGPITLRVPCVKHRVCKVPTCCTFVTAARHRRRLVSNCKHSSPRPMVVSRHVSSEAFVCPCDCHRAIDTGESDFADAWNLYNAGECEQLHRCPTSPRAGVRENAPLELAGKAGAFLGCISCMLASPFRHCAVNLCLDARACEILCQILLVCTISACTLAARYESWILAMNTYDL
jgi:hypothetical protein